MIWVALGIVAESVVLHVSPQGNDGNSGTVARPLLTLEGARLRARTHKGRPVVVQFAAGTYRLDRPLVFQKEDSGDVVYRPKKGAAVTFLGSTSFTPRWQAHTGKIWQCQVPAGFAADQIFVNGERQILARYPNEDLSVRIFNGYAKDAIDPERVKNWKDPAGAFVHAMHAHMWGGYQYEIESKDQSGQLKLKGGWQNNRQMGMHAEYRFVEGVVEELDSPGEWFLDRKAGTLYYYPREGDDLQKMTVEGPVLRNLIEFKGAKGITLNGFRFAHSMRTFMDTKEPLLRSDWAIYRGGAVVFRDSEDCSVTDSVFEDLGGNAIFVDGRNRRLSFKRCRFENIGANGIAFVGQSSSVRNPLFEYGQRQKLADIDLTPGPKSDAYPAECLVEDCLISRTGRVEKQTAPIQIAMAKRITVRHCSIYDVPRAGINIGDGCWGGHVIEGCDVFDTVLETGDHGSFNSWGRDRFWELSDLDMNKGERPELAYLDVVEPNVIRNSRWRCDHGWDIDLDDGSSNYVIENNLCLGGGIKNREGFFRTVQNNIMVDNSFHPHVWLLNSGDVFRRNIVFRPYQPIRVPTPWGREVDSNFLHVPGEKVHSAEVLAKASGRDLKSLIGDAEFVNPAIGDFRVKPSSPVLGLGFRNFAMDKFGVRPRHLKALARKPRLSVGAVEAARPDDERVWRGAAIKNLNQLGEQSATGSAKLEGVLVVAVPVGSEAERMGLRALDVILSADGKGVVSVADLLGIGGVRVLGVWRGQRLVEIRVSE